MFRTQAWHWPGGQRPSPAYSALRPRNLVAHNFCLFYLFVEFDGNFQTSPNEKKFLTGTFRSFYDGQPQTWYKLQKIIPFCMYCLNCDTSGQLTPKLVIVEDEVATNNLDKQFVLACLNLHNLEEKQFVLACFILHNLEEKQFVLACFILHNLEEQPE